MKRLLDIFISLLLLICFFFIILLVAIIVKTQIGSPILFRQQRPGLHGKPFYLYKFRTMTNERDNSGELLPDYARLTKVGKFLRKYSLDELPQLINVLKGQLSLVGPRPLLMEYMPLYSQEQAKRHNVKPGITGWAQINGRNSISWDEKFKLDVWYVENQSFLLDLKILYLTFSKVLKSEGITNNKHVTMPVFKGESSMGGNKMNILFTSSGRRVTLIKKFKEVFEQVGIKGKIFTADLKETAPTIYFSDKHFIVPRVNEEGYINELLKICRSEMINLIIPLIDTELILMANNSEVFEGIGVKVLVSSMELNKIANNKKYTYNFFVSNNIPTPRVYSDEEIERKEYQFPLLIKPYDGSSSKGVTKIMNEKELEFFKEYIPNAMIQEYVSGEEYTIDVMVDFYGNIKTIVPRLRIETRAGEVSKGITKKDFDIIQAAETVIKVLPNPIGCITLQCFKKKDGQITFIEINPRFGGGIPLSIEAGANFPLWTIKMCQGEVFTDRDFNWRENLTMLRYDEAVFMESI